MSGPVRGPWRASARSRSGTPELFAEFDADYREASIDEIVAEQKQLAKERLLKMLGEAVSLRFIEAVDALMQAFMLRETNLKDVCVELAREGRSRTVGAVARASPAIRPNLS